MKIQSVLALLQVKPPLAASMIEGMRQPLCLKERETGWHHIKRLAALQTIVLLVVRVQIDRTPHAGSVPSNDHNGGRVDGQEDGCISTTML